MVISADLLISADTVVTGHVVHRPGWLRIAANRITEVGAGPAPHSGTCQPLVLGDMIVVPGFVDIHVHGGGGSDFADGSAPSVRTAVDLHRRHGSTTIVASVVSQTPKRLRRTVARLAEQVHDGVLAGVHLEGPWLSAFRRGAHDPAALRDPDPAEIAALFSAAEDTVRMVTIAPELPGALPAISQIVDGGAVAAVGHTDADHRQVLAAIGAGARHATHLFNAMRPVHHREPGPVIALSQDPRVTVEVIGDGAHVHPVVHRELVIRLRAGRIALVTDAMAAAGMPDGGYRLGGLAVDVRDGVARVAHHDTLAGGTATMDRLFRFAVAQGGGDQDAALLAAVRQTSSTPARALGLPAGELAAGASADLVVLDADLEVTGVMRQGTWVRDPSQTSNSQTSNAQTSNPRTSTPHGRRAVP